MSSATQTKQADQSADDLPAATALTDDDSPRVPTAPRAIIAGLLVVGWLVILYINSWHLGPSVFFLSVSWLAIVLVGHYLLTAATSAALDDGGSDEEFWKPVGRRDELESEKRALLKTIKEIEFDHETGKMSDDDAATLTRLYRARAIEVIKALSESGGESESLSSRIDQEIKARLAVAGTSKKKRAGASTARKKDSTVRDKSDSASKPGKDEASAPAGTSASEASASEASADEASADEASASEASVGEASADDVPSSTEVGS